VRWLRVIAVLPSAIAVLLPTPALARSSWTGPCLDGQKSPRCHFWKAEIAKRAGGKPVAGVADGDTIRVKIAGQGGAPKSIRIVGINAMELSRYSNIPGRRRGACHGLEATSLIEKYINRAHRVVRLGAQDPGSRSGHRLYRSVAVRLGGRWRDLGRIQLERGLALWLPNGREYAHNAQYRTLAEQAAAAQRGLYDPTSCGAGPSPEARIQMSVNWDAEGNDESNLNDEWVRLRNLGPADVPIGGWWVRDSFLRFGSGHAPGFRFPGSATIPAGGSIQLRAGCGKNTTRDFYWCQRAAVFENVTYGPRDMGDGGYLFDPQGDLRVSMIYPCAVQCQDPLHGAVKLSAHPSSPEYFQLYNAGAAPVDLDGYLLKVSLASNPSVFTHNYYFGGNSAIGAGETLRLWLQGAASKSDRLDKYWGLPAYSLPDRRGRATLRTFTDVVNACDAWGGLSC
jgi:endonuclease YncB( thermonuclease family)